MVTERTKKILRELGKALAVFAVLGFALFFIWSVFSILRLFGVF
jgi:hypothetical protein